jgi:hypothetical protein
MPLFAYPWLNINMNFQLSDATTYEGGTKTYTTTFIHVYINKYYNLYWEYTELLFKPLTIGTGIWEYK